MQQRLDDFHNRMHLSPPRGWLNDPNGFSYYKGVYHLFYQHNPNDASWGPMHWGHAASRDLVRWQHLPVALSPGETYDRDGCFSGTAVVDEGKHVLLYTGNRITSSGGGEGGQEIRQVQCVAIGDGEVYRKIDANPVIGSDRVPPGSSTADFRDPKVWREGDTWYLLVASRSEQTGGELLLYAATDLERWHYVGATHSGGGTFGGVWECPDFFPSGGQEVLIWSTQYVARDGCAYRNRNSSVYAIGSLDRMSGRFEGEDPVLLDYGPDFYAPQTLLAPDGRRILVAWMQMWERTIPTAELEQGWAGAMTIPREVEVVDETLYQRPIREIENYRTNLHRVEERISGERSYPGIRGHFMDIEVRFEDIEADELGIIVKKGQAERTVLTIDVAARIFRFDRSRSGKEIRSTAAASEDVQHYCCELSGTEDRIDLRILLDRSSCEIFVEGGRRVLSATIYPGEESDGIAFFARNGSALLKCSAWELQLRATL